MSNQKRPERFCSNPNCERKADVYAGGPRSGDWADYYCLEHMPSGFRIWDNLTKRTDYGSIATSITKETN